MNTQCPVCGSPLDEHEEACLHCGYRLLGSTQSFQPLPIDTGELKAALTTDKKPATLRIIRGPQIEAVFELADREYHVGRNPQNEIFLNDMTVSRQHATIRRAGTAYEIRDANSFNGVWVNNNSIETCVLKDGDIIQIGAFCLLYRGNR